jgi:fatty-acyl-CoA synthase
MVSAEARILVTAAPFPGFELWQRLQPRLGEVPKLGHVMLVDAIGSECASRPSSDQVEPPRDGTFRIEAFARCLQAERDDHLEGEPEDLSSFLCTGGTTGAPKIAMRRHGNAVANAWSIAQCFGSRMGPGKNVFCGLPLFHANGLMVTGLLPFLTGAHVVLGTPFGYRGSGVIEHFWSIVERHRISFFSAVPTIYGALLQVPTRDHRLDSLEYGLCGAAPMPRELIERFERQTGLRILEGYGLTEAVCASSLNPPAGERRAGSIGLRIPGQSMKVMVSGPEGRLLRDAANGESGHVLVSGPNVFAGYLRAQQNEGLWFDDENGLRWLRTGDLGYRDEDGYFWLTGRAKDLIIRGGHNIDPAAIEQPLYAHPDVQFAAAVGRPDAHAGEVPVVYVQARAGHLPDEGALMAFLAARLGEKAAMPKALLLVDAMPLTAVGKIDKPALRRREAAFALAQALDQAGIASRSVQVVADAATGGTHADVELVDPARRSAAESVLARFALRCTVS